jgi:hypothetical protein
VLEKGKYHTTPVAMTLLAELPLELLDIIFAALPTKDNASLCLTSKGLNLAAERHVYSRFIYDRAMNEQGTHVTDIAPRNKLALLFRTLVSRPELALHLREMVYFGEKLTNAWTDSKILLVDAGETTEPPLTAAELLAIRRTVSTVTSYSESPIDDKKISARSKLILDGSIPTILSLIISMAKHLEILKLDFPMSFLNTKLKDRHILRETLLGLISKAAPGLDGEFLRLKSVDIRVRYRQHVVTRKWRKDKTNNRYGHPYRISLQDSYYSWLFYLPAIKEISLRRIGQDSLKWPLERAPKLSSLTSLSITDSRVNVDNLGLMLTATPNLQDLTYTLRVYDCEHMREHVDSDKLGSAIAMVKSTLRNLVLWYEVRECDVPGGRWGGARAFRGSIGSFATFEKLENLFITYTMLVGDSLGDVRPLPDLLPPNIRNFMLHDNALEFTIYARPEEGFVDRYIDGLSPSAFPKLKKFIVCPDGDTSVIERENHDDLAGRCEKAGVFFNIWPPNMWDSNIAKWTSSSG